VRNLLKRRQSSQKIIQYPYIFEIAAVMRIFALKTKEVIARKKCKVRNFIISIIHQIMLG
jgi:hypothetical protein